jgi:hypothetical protein
MLISLRTLASLLAVVGCSSQADPSYPGQPLATLQGEAIGIDTDSLPPLGIALNWMGSIRNAPDGGIIVINRPAGDMQAAVNGHFPSAFTLQLFVPPLEAAMIPCLGSDPSHPTAGHYAVGFVDAIGDPYPPGDGTGEESYGHAAEFAVIYADTNLSVCEGDVNKFADPAQLSKGYHLYRREFGPCIPTNSGGCRSFSEVPMTTSISLPIRDPLQYPHFVQLSTDAQKCPGPALPADEAGGVACRFVFRRYASNGMPDWGPCDGPGEVPVDDETVAEVTLLALPQPTAYCGLVQIPPDAWVNGSCAQSTQAGWCSPPSTAACTSPVQLSDATPSLNQGGAASFELVCP